MMPGRNTRNGNAICGSAAVSGVRLAAFMESAAIARCTARKSVHQHPNESTRPQAAPAAGLPQPEEHERGGAEDDEKELHDLVVDRARQAAHGDVGEDDNRGHDDESIAPYFRAPPRLNFSR
jgi:hypothetical protein